MIQPYNETTSNYRTTTSVFVGLALFNVGVFAQPQKKPSTASPSRQDIESVIKRLIASGAARPKSEFETTEQYHKRISLLLDPNQLVFLLPVGEAVNDAVRFKYDADNQTMSAEVWGVSNWLVDSDNTPKEDPPLFQVVVKERLLSSRQYVGSNAL